MQLSMSLVAALLAAFTSATAVEKASSNCYTVHSGYLVVSPGDLTKGVNLNQHRQVTYGVGGKALKVNFQACPKVPGNYPNEDQYIGRITVGSDCLTIDNFASTKGPYFVGLAKCSSSTKPSVAQTWTYGGDDRGAVYWKGPPSSGGHIGYVSTSDGTPVVSKATRLVKLGCDTGNPCANFRIAAKLD